MPSEIPSREVLQAPLSGDLNGLISLFADDAVVMPPNDSPLFGKDEIRSWWEEYFQFFKIESSVETDGELTVAGNQAFDRASFTVTIVSRISGTRIRDDVRSLIVWKHEPDGAWKISHQIWNSTKPVGSGTNRYMTRMLQKSSDQRSS